MRNVSGVIVSKMWYYDKVLEGEDLRKIFGWIRYISSLSINKDRSYWETVLWPNNMVRTVYILMFCNGWTNEKM